MIYANCVLALTRDFPVIRCNTCHHPTTVSTGYHHFNISQPWPNVENSNFQLFKSVFILQCSFSLKLLSVKYAYHFQKIEESIEKNNKRRGTIIYLPLHFAALGGMIKTGMLGGGLTHADFSFFENWNDGISIN